MRYTPLGSKFHTGRRQALAQLLEGPWLAILTTAALVVRSGDTHYTYRPDSNFFYLTGIDQPEAVLIMGPGTETLFIKETDEFTAVWEGQRFSREEAATLSGILDVRWLQELDRYLHTVITGAKVLYTSRRDAFAHPQLESSVVPAHAATQSINHHIAKLRLVKQPPELDAIRQAVAATTAGFAAVRSDIESGTHEYQLEAKLSHAFTEAGATHAYEPIVASGAATCIMHYLANDQPLVEGQLLLVDAGAEYAYYASDVTRTYAIGHPTERQQHVYAAVLRVKSAAQKLLLPGTVYRDFELQVRKLMAGELVALGLISATKRTDPTAINRYFPTATSHMMGLDVHDVGTFPQTVLEPGMVLTCEPGIYIPEEGIGARLEDDLLITESGNENLTAAIPMELRS